MLVDILSLDELSVSLQSSVRNWSTSTSFRCASNINNDENKFNIVYESDAYRCTFDVVPPMAHPETEDATALLKMQGEAFQGHLSCHESEQDILHPCLQFTFLSADKKEVQRLVAAFLSCSAAQ